MSHALRWLLVCSMFAGVGCGYLDEELLVDDEAFEESFGYGESITLHGRGWSGGCGMGMGSYGYGSGHGSRVAVAELVMELEAMHILGRRAGLGGAGATSGGAAVDQEAEFARDLAPQGTIEAVVYETVVQREQALAQYGQARSSRAAR